MNCGCRWKWRMLSNCLNWKIYCDDHSSLSSTTAVQKWIISYILHILSYIICNSFCIIVWRIIIIKASLWMTKLQLRVKQKSIISNAANKKTELWKTFRLTSFQKPQLQVFQSSSCLSIRPSFCICFVNSTLFSSFEQLFLCLVTHPTVWILIHFVTQLL